MSLVDENSDEFLQKLLTALDLMELSIELKRQNIVRKNPELSSAEVNIELQSWLNERKSKDRTIV